MPIPKKDSALQRKSAKDLVYETLCDWIIRGEMMPGEKLLDTELAAYFNVSRTPVRDAGDPKADQGDSGPRHYGGRRG